MWINCILSIKIWKGSYNLIIITVYTELFKYFYIRVTLLCTMGDNPYKYCILQWEIIHTLLSCDNIFCVHVLYVFSLVLFYLLMIVQCLDFKSIKLLLFLLSLPPPHTHTEVKRSFNYGSEPDQSGITLCVFSYLF